LSMRAAAAGVFETLETVMPIPERERKTGASPDLPLHGTDP